METGSGSIMFTTSLALDNLGLPESCSRQIHSYNVLRSCCMKGVCAPAVSIAIFLNSVSVFTASVRQSCPPTCPAWTTQEPAPPAANEHRAAHLSPPAARSTAVIAGAPTIPWTVCLPWCIAGGRAQSTRRGCLGRARLCLCSP